MSCINCKSDRLLSIFGKCSDLFVADYKGKEYGPDYVNVPDNVIGRGDDIQFVFCLDCGRIQKTFPVSDPEWFNEEGEE